MLVVPEVCAREYSPREASSVKRGRIVLAWDSDRRHVARPTKYKCSFKTRSLFSPGRASVADPTAAVERGPS